MPDPNRDLAVAFANQLRLARHAALSNAEEYDEIVHVIERLGAYLAKEQLGDKGKRGDLGKYREVLTDLADRSALSFWVPNQHRGLLTPFDELYTLVKNGRNDAMHQGAFARHLTAHAIELAIILEDALAENKEPIAADFIVKNPTCAEMWHPISYIRQQMLVNSYSWLPVNKDGAWYLISDVQIALYLSAERDGPVRRKRLAATLEAAFADLNPKKTEPQPDNIPLADALAALARDPVLLVHRAGDENTLVGLLTAFDLL